MSFKNKRVWITGASSGIGEALAYAFAEKGVQLILSARNEAELQRVATAAKQAGAASVLVHRLDLADHASIPEVVREVLAQSGKVDILINNGGISQRALVKVFNDRGAVICAVRLTERVPAGTVHSYESSARYEPVGEPGHSADRGGCMNVLTPSRMMIRKAHALAANSCLVQIEAWGEDDA